MSRLSTAFVVAALAVTASAPLEGQIVYPGDTRVEMSDVTGPPITSGDLFGPGTVRSFSCPVAWGVRTVADRTTLNLRSGSLPVITAAWTERRLSGTTRDDLLLVLTDDANDDPAARRLIGALVAGNDSREAQAAAKGLVERLDGLLYNAGRLRPDRPGYRTATQLTSAVGAYNTFISHSSAEFLRNPPEALLAIQSVLSPLVIAALENEGREVSRSTAEGGLACAGPTPTVPTPPELPVERATVVCVLASDGIRAIGAIVLASGDTVVMSGGQRVPLAAAFPTRIAYAADSDWYATAEELTLNERRYVRFGLPRLASVEANLRRVGEFRGVPLFAEPGEDHVVVPVRPDCVVQDYRPDRDLRVRG